MQNAIIHIARAYTYVCAHISVASYIAIAIANIYLYGFTYNI